jgi:RNA polymerase sigma-70 factor (TIGR02957 family)
MALSHRPGDQLAPDQLTGMAGTTAEEFEAQRPRLFGLAYRLLGSAVDAEDVIQDAYLRWQGADPSSIAAPRAWLAKVVTNLSLNRLASARAQRERYAGPWLPEPVLTEDGTLGPLEDVTQRESVSLALLVLLERLTPAERAVFVLREAFGYSHGETAQILELSEANCRQLQRRARDRIAQERRRFRPEPGHWRSLADRFLAAARSGDLHSLEGMLAADVTAWTDGGGKVTAARRPVTGRVRVARYLAGAAGKFGAGARAVFAEVNGEPAIVGISGSTVIGVLVLEVSGGEISAVRAVANPDKLHFAAQQAMGLSHLESLPGLS